MSSNYRIFKKFIDDKTCSLLENWAFDAFDSGFLIERGPGRFNNHLDKIPSKNLILDEIAVRIKQKLPACIVEPDLRYFVSINTKGASMTNHIDPAVVGSKHLRFNIWVTSPKGGRPILHPKSGDEIVDVELGDMWCLFASDFYHETEPVESDTRISISFGFLVPGDFTLQDIK